MLSNQHWCHGDRMKVSFMVAHRGEAECPKSAEDFPTPHNLEPVYTNIQAASKVRSKLYDQNY
jgi:hypothetical protein